MRSPKTVFAVLFTLALAGQTAFADEAHTLSVRLDWLTTGYQAPFFLAAEKGWFKKAGLDVTIQQGTGSVTTVQLVGGGLASATAAETLRAAGAEGSIAILCAKSHSPLPPASPLEGLSPQGSGPHQHSDL